MNKFACRYAIVQFMPYAETGEFANVGVILVCPKTGYFGFKLQTRRYGRITAFFNELEGRIYTKAIHAFGIELLRIKDVVLQSSQQSNSAQFIRDTFVNLVHPREALIRFGDARSLLTMSPEQGLADLFKHYVERDFATQEYIEKKIETQLNRLLKGLTLSAPFKQERIGDDEIYANFPLVQKQEGQINKIIKPFNLSQAEPNDIYSHGDSWIQKIKRLHKRSFLPEQILFAVATPPIGEAKRYAAYQEICNELRGQEIEVIPSNQENAIAAFALN
jgi:hypothetical protein